MKKAVAIIAAFLIVLLIGVSVWQQIEIKQLKDDITCLFVENSQQYIETDDLKTAFDDYCAKQDEINGNVFDFADAQLELNDSIIKYLQIKELAP